MILLDTNILSELMKSAPEKCVVEWIDTHPESEFYISSITKAEIELGLALLPAGIRKTNLVRASELMFADFSGHCLAFDSAAASQYAVVVANRTRIGRPVSVEDAQIAAIALANSMSLATRNSGDFEFIDKLTVINPWNLSG